MDKLIPGTVLNNKYKIKDFLGKGAMGTVYLVEEINNQKNLYAVKELISDFPDPVQQEIAHKTFETEIKFLTHLNHRQLPQIQETFNQWNRYYLVMEYIEGESLEAILEGDKGPLPQDDVLDWAIQITEVLEYFHSQPMGPVVYRDIKPAYPGVPNLIVSVSFPASYLLAIPRSTSFTVPVGVIITFAGLISLYTTGPIG